MEVNEGYKQTEVGAIPVDWEVSALDYVAKIIDPQPDHRTPPVAAGGEPYIGISDFLDDHAVNWEASRKVISRAVDKQQSRFRLQPGDIIFGKIGTIGVPRFVPSVPFRYALSANVLLIQPTIEPYFVMSWLKSKTCERAIYGELHSTSQAAFGINKMRRVVIPLPPTKAEQEAIADALSEADALIESLQQLLVKKRQIKQGAMQELLTGKKRLPGFSGEWEERTVLELAGGKKELFDDGDWIEAEHITNAGVRLVQTGNIGVGQFVEKNEKKYIFEESFVSLHCKEIKQGDLLICRLAEPAGRACVFPDIGEMKVVTSVDVTIFRPPSAAADRVFLANLFSTNNWFRAINDRSGGTTHKRISRGALGRITIRIPRAEEQTAIATILSDMDTEITALETKLAKTRNIKQGMMQELLTGRIRLV